ncbi:Myrosinase 1 [Gryllus bimaculatus]|nr:Myrosinase 1 [Gryllus bimaculatus]
MKSATAREGSDATLTFPPSFKFGVATAAYQVEGAWDEDGKGENIWDHLLHKNPEFTEDRANGDIANDSYHRYKEDVQLVKALNVDFYRFSIAWSRILPKGDLSVVNQKGLDYYNNLIDEVVANGIEPMVTIYHWDLPHELQKLGQVGIVFGGSWAIPKTDSQDDIAAAERYMQFYLGWFAHPIFSQEGDYPHVMRQRVSANSAREGLRRSRLPQFSREEIELLRGSADFLGLNHYTSFLVEADETGPCPSLGRDSGAVLSQDPSWPVSGSSWLKGEIWIIPGRLQQS